MDKVIYRERDRAREAGFSNLSETENGQNLLIKHFHIGMLGVKRSFTTARHNNQDNEKRLYIQQI